MNRNLNTMGCNDSKVKQENYTLYFFPQHKEQILLFEPLKFHFTVVVVKLLEVEVKMEKQ